MPPIPVSTKLASVIGLRILGIIEVEHGIAGNDAAGDRGDAVTQRQGAQQAGRNESLKRLMERHIAAGDRGRAGAAIGLQHVAVDADLALAEPGEIGHRAQAAADQPLDLLGAPALPAARRLAVGAGRRRARQHAVFGGDPAPAGVAQKRRHALLDRGGAQHMGVAELRQARALGVFGYPRLERDRRIASGARPEGRIILSCYSAPPLPPPRAGEAWC